MTKNQREMTDRNHTPTTMVVENASVNTTLRSREVNETKNIGSSNIKFNPIALITSFIQNIQDSYEKHKDELRENFINKKIERSIEGYKNIKKRNRINFYAYQSGNNNHPYQPIYKYVDYRSKYNNDID